jgi:uncharacterized protein with LGFP repeats
LATEHDAHLVRWKMIKSTGIPYNPENAIPTYFREHAELGSPLGPELPRDGGGVVQAFTGGVVRWTAESGVELVVD